MANLCLDTDVRLHYAYIAYVAAGSPYTIGELDEIFRDEVAPVYESNIIEVAGEWAMFTDDGVIGSVTKYLSRNPERPYVMQSWALDDFRDLHVLIRALRRMPVQERKPRYLLWHALSQVVIDRSASRPEEMPDRETAEQIFREEVMPAYGRKIDAYDRPTRDEIAARWQSWLATAAA